MNEDRKQVWSPEWETATKEARIRLLLSDGQWHNSKELADVTHRFSGTIFVIRNNGWVIHKRYNKEAHTWEYRWGGR